MAPKKDILKSMPKWWLKVRKWKKAPFIPKPHFSPRFPNQERRDQIAKSVVCLSLGTGDGYDTCIPVINLRLHQGSHCLLFESTLMRNRQRRVADPLDVCTLEFPDDGRVSLPMNAMEERVFEREEKMRLVALSYRTYATQCPAINFGRRVVEGQKVFFFDFRDRKPSLVEGNVTCVTEEAFVLDAKWYENALLGALVFDETNSLVGVVYHHAGSPIAINIPCLQRYLWSFFPQTEDIGAFHHRLQQIAAQRPPHHG